jgi:hypothetical protein
MFSRSRAEALVEALDLDLDRVAHCSMCVWGVSCELEAGGRKLEGALRTFVPMLWDEGFDASLVDVLRRGRRAGVADASAGLADVEARGSRSAVVRAAVLRLARQQRMEVERAVNASRN